MSSTMSTTMNTTRVDISKLRRRLRAAGAARANAASAAMAVMVQTLGENLAVNSPRDTNRYVRGWMQAATQAGAKGLPQPQLQPSRFRSVQETALKRQYIFWNTKAEIRQRWLTKWWYSRGLDPAESRLGRKAESEYQRFRKRADKARQEWLDFIVAKDPVIVIGRTLGNRGVRGKADAGGRALITIRREVYGGTGAVVIRRDRIDAYLHNREPHARIVEARHHTFAKSFAVLKVFGVRRAGSTFVKHVKAAFAKAK